MSESGSHTGFDASDCFCAFSMYSNFVESWHSLIFFEGPEVNMSIV